MTSPLEMPLVSVVIFWEGRREFLVNAVDSVMAQDYPQFEILVGGDGRHGESDVVNRSPAVRLFDCDGFGRAAARNTGIRESKGTYVVIMDPGDRLLPNALRAGVTSLQARAERGFASGRYRTVSQDGSVLWESHPTRPVVSDHYVELLRGDYIVDVGAVVMYRKSVLESVGGFDVSLAAGVEFELCARILREFPAYFHGELVAERRKGAAKTPVDASVRFSASIGVLRSQRGHLTANEHYLKAYRGGMANLAQRHGLEVFDELRLAVRGGAWKEAAWALAALVRYLLALLRRYPLGLPPVVAVCLVPGATRRSSALRRIESCISASGREPRTSSVLRFRATTRAVVPRGGRVLVVAEEGEDEVLELDGLQAWRFPPFGGLEASDPLGVPAGSEPTARLDALRSQGAQFLVVPSTAFWWLDHYQADFKAHLDLTYRRVWEDEHCVIYALAETEPNSSRRALVGGFFSFERGGTTAGDLLARDVVCEWLEEANCPYDVALAQSFEGGVDWHAVDPKRYSHVVFVCGPYLDNRGQSAFLRRFAGSYLIGLNLSMPTPPQGSHPFDLLLERDSADTARPDITLCSRQRNVPVVGVCLREHAEGTRAANAAIRRLLAGKEMSIVEIDTRLDANSTGLRSPAEVESLLARMDLVITTRLHGMVLALKNGVPVVAVDPQAGGGKIRRQASAIGWPVILDADALTDESLREAFAYCLTADARTKAGDCAEAGSKALRQVRDAFIATL